MPLITVLMATPAWATTAVWLQGTPDPSVTPGATLATPADVAPAPYFDDLDRPDIVALRAELRAVRPLLDEFDGELAIIRRLDLAVSAVDLLPSDDVELLWRALVLQGLAVHRYFPDLTSEEAKAAGVVIQRGSQVENRPWAEALALLPDRVPGEVAIPDSAARLAFQEQRARAVLQPPVTIEVQHAPGGAEVVVDGMTSGEGEVRVAAGKHRVAIKVGDKLQHHTVVDVEPGATLTLTHHASPADLADLAALLSTVDGPVPLAPAVTARLEELEDDVLLIVPGKRSPRVFTVVDGQAVPRDAASPGAASDGGGGGFWVLAGAGLVYDGDYLLQNAAAGAPEEVATVNAASPVVGIGARLPVGPVHVGGGLDVSLPVGEHHTLPSGEGTLRLRAHPHAAVGYGPAALTVGWWTPWHIGLGVRATVPLGDRLGVQGAYVHGIGITRARDAGPDFEPAASRVGWIAAVARFGG